MELTIAHEEHFATGALIEGAGPGAARRAGAAGGGSERFARFERDHPRSNYRARLDGLLGPAGRP
jgi:hypothetical protein